MGNNGVLIVTNLAGKGVTGKTYRRARSRFEEVKDELFVTRTERAYVKGLAKKYSDFDTVVGIGGGVAVAGAAVAAHESASR